MENLLAHTERITLELSNQCDMAAHHKACPLSLEIGCPKILPSTVITDVLQTLGHLSFVGTIAFHNYNEPLADPRLDSILAEAKAACPSAELYFSTNGSLLTQERLDRLVAAGLSRIAVSAYSKSEFARLSSLTYPIPNLVAPMSLIPDHLSIYDLPEKNSRIPCHAPLREIIVSRDANILLCCREWQRRHTFGNLVVQTFEEILRGGELQAAYARLSRGDRYLYLCKRCDWVR